VPPWPPLDLWPDLLSPGRLGLARAAVQVRETCVGILETGLRDWAKSLYECDRFGVYAVERNAFHIHPFCRTGDVWSAKKICPVVSVSSYAKRSNRSADRRSKLITFSAALAGAVCTWGALIEPRLVERRQQVADLPGLPEAWEGRSIAVFADIQVGIPLANVDTVRRIVRRILAEPPSLVLLAGDFVYHTTTDPAARCREVAQAASLLRPLPAAGIPTYAVLGNHDYAEQSRSAPLEQQAAGRRVEVALREAGIHVLRNEAVALPEPGAPHSGNPPALYLVGLDSYRRGGVPRHAFDSLPSCAPRIVLLHNPRSFAGLPAHAAPLAFAGHTHGGQIRVPFRPTWTLARLRKAWPLYADGWIEGYGQPGNRLYITRGVGFSHVPIRIGCRPEYTVLRLTAGTRTAG
jgi:predicted MPP superfamily phosphohydrolase